MSTINDDDDGSVPEAGGVNSARTRASCSCCEKILKFDPSWTADTSCPSCNEDIFSYCCDGCYAYEMPHGATTNPAFPGMQCGCCGKTCEEQEEEEQNEKRLEEEKERVSHGANFRAAKIKEPFPVYQNNIMLTRRALYGKARPGAPPVSEGDALRMSDEDFAKLRPLIAAELGDEADKILTVDWCRHQITVFERSWQSEYMAKLERGLIQDWTGKPYHLGLGMYSNKVKLRGLREVQMEEGCLPIAPAVKIDEKSWGDTKEDRSNNPLEDFVSWEDLPENFDQDPREIYKSDGDKSLTLFEFLVWSARVGGFGGQEPNPKWNIEDYTPGAARFSTIEPLAYVPSDWVGRPKSFAADKGRWHWVQEQLSKGDFQNVQQLNERLEANMKLCSVCYGPPKDGTDLILCECGTVYWCGEKCKKKAWELHSLDHRVRHSTGVKRACLACGKSGGNELMRCSRCQNAFFCDRECQQSCWNAIWKPHKKECKEYTRGGRKVWSTIV